MKNILVVSWHFAPQNVTGAIRLTKIVKYLARTGEYHFWVICKEIDEKEIHDKILQRDMEEVSEYVTICPVHINRLEIIDRIKSGILGKLIGQQKSSDIKYSDIDRKLISNTDSSIKGKIKRFIGKVFIFINDIYIFMSNDVVFARSGFKAYKQMNISNSIDTMISTWGPTGNLLLGLKIKKNNKNIKWIVDYRDLCITSFRVKQICLSYIAYKADKAAKYITGVSKQYNGSGKYMKKFHAIINSYDKEDIKDFPVINIRNNKLKIVYTGGVYKKRNVEFIFKILHELADEKKINLQFVSFEYAGRDFGIVEENARRYDVVDILINHGILPREKALELQYEADILTLVTWNNEEEGDAPTGKFIEYFMMKKPIFSIVIGDRKNSIVKQITDRANIGYSYEESSGYDGYLEAKQWVLEKYLEFLENGQVDFNSDEMFVDKFSSANMAKRFKRLIDK